MSPETVTLEDALRLLDAAAHARRVRRRGGRRRERPLRAVRQEGHRDPLARQTRSSSSRSRSTRRWRCSPSRSARGRGAAAPPLRELGDDPVSGKPIVLKEGRFGPYVTDGETNASLRSGDTVETMTPERAAELIQARRDRGPTKKRRKRAARNEDANGVQHFRLETVHNQRSGKEWARVRRALEWAVRWRPLPGGGLQVWKRCGERKDIDSELTQSQLTELLETESARALIEAGEERGWIEPAELEAFALENDLGRRRYRRRVKRARAHRARGARAGARGAQEEGAARAGRVRGRPAVGRGRQPAALPRRRRQAQAADRPRGGHAREGDRARRPVARSAA